MRFETALGEGARKSGWLGGWLRSLVNRGRIAALDLAEERTRSREAAAGPTVQERQQELARFYSHYENLVEVLCDSAQYGPTPKLEKEYAAHREWMHANYPPIRRYIVAYLRFSSEDAEQSLTLQGRVADAFEALVAAPNLSEFLDSDDGSMISRIERTREALTLYADHLRKLAEAS